MEVLWPRPGYSRTSPRPSKSRKLYIAMGVETLTLFAPARVYLSAPTPSLFTTTSRCFFYKRSSFSTSVSRYTLSSDARTTSPIFPSHLPSVHFWVWTLMQHRLRHLGHHMRHLRGTGCLLRAKAVRLAHPVIVPLLRYPQTLDCLGAESRQAPSHQHRVLFSTRMS